MRILVNSRYAPCRFFIPPPCHRLWKNGRTSNEKSIFFLLGRTQWNHSRNLSTKAGSALPVSTIPSGQDRPDNSFHHCSMPPRSVEPCLCSTSVVAPATSQSRRPNAAQDPAASTFARKHFQYAQK